MGGCESKDDLLVKNEKVITKTNEVKVEVVKEIMVKIPVIKSFECQISSEAYTEENYAVVLSCGHSICLKCYYNIIIDTNKCPYDKKEIDLKEPIKNFALMNEINKKESNINTYYNLNVDDVQENDDKLSLICPNSHKLKFFGNSKFCTLHVAKDIVLGCEEDNFFQCINKCLRNKINFSKNQCLLNHDLEWFVGFSFKCLQCKDESYFGFKCNDNCLNYKQCIYCSDFKFSTHLCPNNHCLIWS